MFPCVASNIHVQLCLAAAPMSGITVCPECSEPFVKHTAETTTLLGYYDGHHDHDDNCLKRVYVCKNEHRTLLSIIRTCSTSYDCDWTGKKRCFCHPGDKVVAWPDTTHGQIQGREENFRYYP